MSEKIAINVSLRVLIYIAVLASLSVIILPRHSLAASVGKFTFVTGRVDVLKPGAKRAVPVKLGDRVFVGDIVRTKSRSRAQVTFIDDSVINIAAKSRIGVKKFFFEPEKKRRSSLLRSFRGMIRAVIPKMFIKDDSRFEIETPTAVAAVRGTDWIMTTKIKTTDVVVLDGLVAVKNILPEIVGEVLVGVNHVTTVAMNRPPSPPRPVTP